MNYGVIRKIVGKILILLSVLLLVPIIFCICYQEVFRNYLAFLIPACGSFISGFILFKTAGKESRMGAKEGFIIVGITWILMSLFGAVPFMISKVLPNFFDAFFEIASGFSTTGSTVIGDVESLVINNHSVMFWRSFSHWIGGLGLLVFILAIIPEAGNGQALHILRAESSGPQVEKLVTKMKSSSRILYLIYIGLTLIEIVLLLLDKDMNLYNSIIHALGTAGTGGFSTFNDSITSCSAYVQYVIAVFMIIFGINFNLFYFILIKNFKGVYKNTEFKVYLAVLIVSISIICINTYNLYDSFEECFRTSLFQVTSIISTTGYGSADFNLWPGLSQLVIVILMFTGACAGSTAGGLKLSRIVILVKSSMKRLAETINPRKVKIVKVDGKPITEEIVSSVHVYFFLYMLSLFIVTILISLDGRCDILTNFTAALSCLSNIGPGLNKVGPTSNFGPTGANYSSFSKFVLGMTMLAGRLELLPIFIVFSPKTYAK